MGDRKAIREVLRQFEKACRATDMEVTHEDAACLVADAGAKLADALHKILEAPPDPDVVRAFVERLADPNRCCGDEGEGIGYDARRVLQEANDHDAEDIEEQD